MMSKQARIEYVREIKPAYLKTLRREKTEKLDEAVCLTEYNWSYLIRLLSPKTDLVKRERAGKRAGRRWRYDARLILVLTKIWTLLDYPCGLRLKAVLPEMIDTLRRCKEIELSDEEETTLLKISSRTIDRRLKRGI